MKTPKKSFTIFALLAGITFSYAQEKVEYATPWYGIVGLLYNTGHYKGNITSKNISLAYFDVRYVHFGKNGFMDIGGPVAGWLATRVFSSGDKTSFIKDEGEVSYLYFKIGKRIIDWKGVSLGAGFSGDIRGVSVKDIGQTVNGFWGFSPLVYARINAAFLTIVPIAEYNILYSAKRRGFTFGTYVVFPVSKNLGITINPSYELANYKFKTTGNKMSSSNLFLRVGLVKKI